MISLDYSIIPAIVIFLTLIVVLNYLLFRPLLRVQAERESRTTGLLLVARKKIEHHLDLFNRYQATIKNARLEAYRRQEEVRSGAMKERGEALKRARQSAEKLVQEASDSIQTQVQIAKEQFGKEAQEIARGIVSTILQRSS